MIIGVVGLTVDRPKMSYIKLFSMTVGILRREYTNDLLYRFSFMLLLEKLILVPYIY